MSEQPAETNGAGQQPAFTREMLNQRLDEVLFPVVNSVIMGCKVTMMGPPPEIMLTAICRTVGRIMGLQFANGDLLVPTMKARKECLDEFEKGIKSIKLQHTAKPEAPMTAMARSGL